MMKIVECPRDAMQGISPFIPTQVKADYINALLKVGFDTIDFGSFVSPQAIPQMRDTAEVLSLLELEETDSQLLAIIANERGAHDACQFFEIAYLGFPFSVSETFQQRNTHSSLEHSLQRVESIQSLCQQHHKELVLYLSMAFGNPYGDAWSEDIVLHWAERIHRELGVTLFALADTIGVSHPENITVLFTHLIAEFPQIEWGAHLHTTPDRWEEKVEAAYAAGCRWFDVALKGFGGCPLAEEELVGNMPTEKLLRYLDEQGVDVGIDKRALEVALQKTEAIFAR